MSRFLLTRPLRDVTDMQHEMQHENRFLLTRPLRDVTCELSCEINGAWISTHTPLAGRDCGTVLPGLEPGISTHTPLAGRD